MTRLMAPVQLHHKLYALTRTPSGVSMRPHIKKARMDIYIWSPFINNLMNIIFGMKSFSIAFSSSFILCAVAKILFFKLTSTPS